MFIQIDTGSRCETQESETPMPSLASTKYLSWLKFSFPVHSQNLIPIITVCNVLERKTELSGLKNAVNVSSGAELS